MGATFCNFLQSAYKIWSCEWLISCGVVCLQQLYMVKAHELSAILAANWGACWHDLFAYNMCYCVCVLFLFFFPVFLNQSFTWDRWNWYIVLLQRNILNPNYVHILLFLFPVVSATCIWSHTVNMSGQAKAKVMESSSTDAKGMQLQFSYTDM